jgi:hypothetical protein
LSHLCLGLSKRFFPSDFYCWCVFLSPHIGHQSRLGLSSSNWSPWWLLVRSKNHETPRYPFFSIVLLLHVFYPNVFLSALFTDIVIRYSSLNVRGQICFTSVRNNRQGWVFVFILRFCK